MLNALVIVALETELNAKNLPPNLPIIYTGVGKVNAALATIGAIDRYKPDIIINFGTAGGITVTATGLLTVGRVIQRDMIAEPLAPRGITPFSNGPHEFISIKGGITCGTGDSFVTTRDDWLYFNKVDVVDMELFAIAAAAHRAGVVWISYKFISDNANDEAATDWQRKINDGEKLFLEELSNLGIR